MGYSSFLSANLEDYYPIQTKFTASNYGNTGIMEMPNANFMREGSLRFNFSSSFPNEYTSVTASPFSWLEATYRYVEIKNKLYGPRSYSGNQSWKDKGFDLKFGLKKETNFSPAFALGLRDLAGTGVFSSEYLVASKQMGLLNITAGLGWGLLGSEDNISNPFEGISPNFEDRIKSGDEGGGINYNSWFSGRTALFGGLEYNLRSKKMKFNLEYDTSNPDELGFNPTKVNSRFNLGMNYFISESASVGINYERGNEFRFSFRITGNFSEDTLPKPRPRNVLNLDNERLKKAREDKEIFYRSLNRSLRDESVFIQGATYGEKEVEIVVASSRLGSTPRALGRTARIASALSDEAIDKINIHMMNGDFEVSAASINRKEFDQADSKKGSAPELFHKTVLFSDSSNPKYLSTDFQPKINFPEFSWNMSPALKHQIGGPESFYLGQLWWRTDANIKFNRNLTLYSSFGLNIYNNFSEFNNPSYSTLPHVRSDIQEYLSEGENNIAMLKLEYMYSPLKDVYFRADLGLLEEMFGGLGGEILYRPFAENYAFGITMHRVRQRDYDQKFEFRNYETTTGHLEFFYDFANGVSSQVLLGKYLAGDKGITLDLSKRFDTGFTLGVFASKTNLSSEEFGEGSFDKGFYFAVPTELFFTDYRSGFISFGLHPLTKDGAALLNTHNSLFGIVGGTNRSSLVNKWKDILD